MKKTILAIALLTAVIVSCKKSSTTSPVTGGWSGTLGTGVPVNIYWQINNNGTISSYTGTSTNPANPLPAGVGVYQGKWNFSGNKFTAIVDSVSTVGPHFYDTVIVSSDFKTMVGNERDTIGGTTYQNFALNLIRVSN